MAQLRWGQVVRMHGLEIYTQSPASMEKVRGGMEQAVIGTIYGPWHSRRRKIDRTSRLSPPVPYHRAPSPPRRGTGCSLKAMCPRTLTAFRLRERGAREPRRMARHRTVTAAATQETHPKFSQAVVRAPAGPVLGTPPRPLGHPLVLVVHLVDAGTHKKTSTAHRR